MKENTEKIHAARLLKMLKRKNACDLCPAARRQGGKKEYLSWNMWRNYPCRICLSFLGSQDWTIEACPCDQHGYKEAIKRTWIQLEAKRYLK